MKEVFAVLIVVGAFCFGYTKYSEIIDPIQELPAAIESELSPVTPDSLEISNSPEE